MVPKAVLNLFPPKQRKFWGKPTMELAERRRQALQSYLQAAVPQILFFKGTTSRTALSTEAPGHPRWVAQPVSLGLHMR